MKIILNIKDYKRKINKQVYFGRVFGNQRYKDVNVFLNKFMWLRCC